MSLLAFNNMHMLHDRSIGDIEMVIIVLFPQSCALRPRNLGR
jgi:hypothetical protein